MISRLGQASISLPVAFHMRTGRDGADARSNLAQQGVGIVGCRQMVGFVGGIKGGNDMGHQVTDA